MVAVLAPAAVQAAPSDLDPNWGTNGIAKAAAGSTLAFGDPIVQPSGKVVVAGVSGGKIVLHRFSPNGTLDPSYGTNGTVATNLVPNTQNSAFTAGVGGAPDGGVHIAVGVGTKNIAIKRFSPDGAVTSSSDVALSGGKVFPEAVVVRPNGSTYVAGMVECAGADCFSVAKFKPGDGLDTTFNAGKGYQTVKIGGAARALDLDVGTALDGTDRITVVGSTKSTNASAADTAIVRFKGNGTQDTTFDGDGIRTLDLSGASQNDFATSVVTTGSGAVTISASVGTQGAVARLTPTGASDPGFGTAGVVRGGFAPATASYTPAAIAIDGNANVLVAGRTQDPATLVGRWTMSRLTSTGAFDSNFAPGGTVAYAPCAASAASGPRGITLVGGSTYIGGGCDADNRTAVARLNGPPFIGPLTFTASPNSGPAGHREVNNAGVNLSKLIAAADALQSVGVKRIGVKRIGVKRIGVKRIGVKRIGVKRIADQTLLTQAPLVEGSWEQLLAGLVDQPIQTLTLADVIDLPAVQNLSAFDIDWSETPLREVSLAAFMMGTLPVANYPAPLGANTCAYLANKPFNCSNGVNPSVTSLIDLDLENDMSDYFADPINLVGVDLGTGDLRAPLAILQLSDLDLRFVPAGEIPAAQLSSILSCGACNGTLAELQQQNPSALGTATVGDLIERLPVAAASTSFIGDWLWGIIPPDEIPYEVLDKQVMLDLAGFRSTNLQTYSASFTVDCSQSTGLKAVLTPAGDARPVPGTAQAAIGSTVKTIADPNKAQDGSYTFDLTPACQGTPGVVSVTFSFKVEPGSVLGTRTTQLAVSSQFGQLDPVSRNVTVDDSLDPGNEPGSAEPLPLGKLVSAHISSPTDVDYYRVPAPCAGCDLQVKAFKLPADYDITILGPTPALPVSEARSSGVKRIGVKRIAVPDQSTQPIDETQPADTLQDIGVKRIDEGTSVRSNSINRGDADEAASVVSTSADQGSDFLIAVTGYNSANDDETYTVVGTTSQPAPAPPCQSLAPLTVGANHTLPNANNVDNNTAALYLFNEQRMTAREGAAATQEVKSRLQQVAQLTNGIIVPVDLNQTADEYAALDASPCSPTAANNVAAAINGVVDQLRAENGGLSNLRTIQIVGPDREIPQARVLDQTEYANEREYAPEAAGSEDNPQSRAMRESYLLTDDPYGDFDPGKELYTPDVALGRLVEGATAIRRQLQDFIDGTGFVNPTRSFVTGYDFLSDGAQQTFDALSQRSAGQILLESWTADQARDGANAAGAVFGAINAHYDHQRALPGAPNDRMLDASELSPAAGSVLFTVGCHSGLNLAVSNDFAQQLSTSGVLYTGNTGYGYGDTVAVAYSELLMADYAKGLASGGVTAGQALMFAKQRSAAQFATTDDYWQKALMEATFYGLAATRIGANGQQAPSALPEPLNGQPNPVRASSTFSITPNFTRHDTDRGSYWTADGFDPLVIQNRPLQPRTIVDVTPADGAPVHGAIIESLSTSTIDGVDHVIARPTIDDSASEPEPDDTTTFFPAQLLDTAIEQTPTGPKDKLTLHAGQARDDQQRLLNTVGVRVFRSHSTDYEPNTITRVDGFVHNNGFSISVDVTGGGEDGGRVLYRTDAGPQWHSVPLAVVAPGRLGTGGSLPAGATRIVEADVSVFDVNGNVARSNLKVVGYSFSPTVTDPGDPRIILNPGAPPTGYYGAGQPINVTVDKGVHGGEFFEYQIDTGDWTPYNGAFTVQPTEGEHVIRARSESTFAETRYAVDTTGPDVTASATAAPNADGWYNGPVTVTFQCADAVSGVATCSAPKTLSSQGAGQSASGTGTDRAGFSGTGTLDGINIDLTKPTITAQTTATKNAAGWYKTDVTYTFTCNDALSQIKTCPAPVTLGEGANQTVTGTAVDKAGNTQTVTVNDIDIDKTPPMLAVSRNVQLSSFGWYPGPVTFTFTCTDNLSGLKGSCPSPVTVGQTVGTNVTRTIEDNAGHSATFSEIVKVDVNNPSVTVTSSVITFGQPIRGRVTDLNGISSTIDKVLVRYDGGAAVAATLSCNAARTDCTWSRPSPSSGVFVNVSATAFDKAGRTDTGTGGVTIIV